MAWYNPTDPVQRNWMLGGLAILALIIPFRMYILAPRQAENTQLQAEVETLEVQNRRASVLSAQGGGDLEQRMALYERHVAKLEELIPGVEEVATLADEIAGQARVTGIEIDRMVPEPREPGVYYDRSSYEMAVIGEYHGVARFLTRVASLSRIVTPVEVDVQLFPQTQRFPEMESPVLATFRIETYVLPDPASAPTAQGPGD